MRSLARSRAAQREGLPKVLDGVALRDDVAGGGLLSRLSGHRLTNGARRKAIRALQTLIASGIPDEAAREEIAQQFGVSTRTARLWGEAAYSQLAAEVDVDRKRLAGSALRTRRLILAQALKRGDFRLALAASDAIGRLLGLDAPTKVQHDVIVEKVGDMSRAVVDVVRDFFSDRPDERARFVEALRTRLNAQLAQRPDKVALVIDAPEAGDEEVVEASDARAGPPTADVAPTATPVPDAPPSD